MSGRGEQPEHEAQSKVSEITVGQTLYDEDGTPVGDVRGIEAGGVFLTMRDGMESLSVSHARSGHSFGEAELVWRCTECGEMGELADGLPEGCPRCHTPRENLMYWTED